jgi:hypothetical protein
MVIKIVFIIIALIFYLYSKGKKAQEQQQQNQQKPGGGTPTYTPQNQAKKEKTIDEILRELQQQVEGAKEVKKQPAKPKPLFEQQEQPSQKSTGSDILLHERRTTTKELEEGKSAYEPVYERELTDEEKIERGTLKLQNEGAYKIEEEVEKAAFIFDPQQALISSVILDRPYK